MCGIFGFWSREGRDVEWNGALLRRATALVAHRGPDGTVTAGWDRAGERLPATPRDAGPLEIGLGHCRLSIIDLSDAGRQPMVGPDGSWISYNGEIYNYRELRRELEGFGHRFRTGSDTEVLLAAYAQWGTSCVEHLNGMWAFLLYDPRRRRLIASRDRLGVKPLYYARTDAGIVFGSEIAALLACPGVSPEIVPERLAEWLVTRRLDHREETIYRDIVELRGAHQLVLDTGTGELDVRRYWGFPPAADLDLTDGQVLDRFSELIEDAVRLRLHADVPVAVTLSGGVDSSVLTVAASRVAGDRVRTFTSRFPGMGRIDESAFAAEVAAACGASAHYVEPRLDRLLDEEPELTRHQAMPYVSLSLYVHWAILQRIREQDVPVVISGQGGDECFFGYDRFHAMAFLHSLPHLPAAVRGAWQGAGRSGLGPRRMAANLAYFSLPSIQRRLRERRFAGLVRTEWLAAPPSDPDIVGDPLRQQWLELGRLSLPTLLRYDDRNAGAMGMETRLPFLDYRVVEFACRLPLRHKLRQGWTKYLLRRYLERHGLPSIAWRRAKVGFEAPQAAWTRELIAARGAQLQAGAFARAFLAPGARLETAPPRAAWDLYNCLHLAHLLGWTGASDPSRPAPSRPVRAAPVPELR
ncbi:MAG TPA: asparagine synthase (glutamine-hydrolyzing) [Gemmatimonadales bacterium]|nr:asparagine synthase (glutamine-hydrolyzing) [Gemmatimonadales bacterium]